MRKLYFHIHGTTDMPFISAPSVIKFFASFQHSDLFTPSTSHAFIPLKEAPKAAQNFEPLYKNIAQHDRFYYQWSGGLGESYWETAADLMAKQIEEMTKDEILSDVPVEITVMAHSHGGQIARLAAQKLEHYRNIKFNVISVCTPLSISPPTIMSTNVKSWQHFYDEGDIFAYMGSMLMQGVLSQAPVKRKIEDVLASHPRGKLRSISKLQWQSHQLKQKSDPHNNALRKPTADYICETVAAVSGDKMGGLKRRMPEASDQQQPPKKRVKK